MASVTPNAAAGMKHIERTLMRPDPGTSSPVLAILTPRWAAPSETFIWRHLTSLNPGRTVALTRRIRIADANWCPGVPVHSINEIPKSAFYQVAREFGAWRLDRRVAAVRRFLQEHGVGVMMAEWLDFATGWFPTVRQMDIRFFAHAHGFDVGLQALREVKNRFRYRRLKEMDGVITVSHLAKRRLVEFAKLSPEKIHVIPCGVEVPGTIVRRPPSEHVICLHVGRLVEKKGPLISVRAFQAAKKHFPGLRLEMIGDGPRLAACQRYCRDQGLANVVTFHGFQPPAFVKQRLAAADIFLHHSVTAETGDEEGLPVAILEAMSCGLPVVSTRHSGIPEAVLEGQTGLLVNERDEEATAQSIRELATQPELRWQMGVAGHRRAKEMYSAEQEIFRLRRLMFESV